MVNPETWLLELTNGPGPWQAIPDPFSGGAKLRSSFKTLGAPSIHREKTPSIKIGISNKFETQSPRPDNRHLLQVHTKKVGSLQGPPEQQRVAPCLQNSRAQPRQARSPGTGPGSRSIPSANIWCVLYTEVEMLSRRLLEGPSPSPRCSLSQG